ncbi:MAG: 50S ribosomal protein L11 methyltransferase [Chloroflexi bacterium]|nr:50S ribosomal protein L11 methyltransferase [Chloroflexota bacterium]
MRWLELSIRVDSESAEAVAEVFHRFGHGGVVMEECVSVSPDGEAYTVEREKPVTLKTYLPANRSLPRRKSQIAHAIKLLSLIRPMPSVEEREINEEDWANAWKSHFDVHRLGSRLVVKPTWRSYSPQESEVVIELDPGMAFGTGLHPTTRMCLEELEKRLKPGMKVLDLGTGSGILAIAAAKLGASQVVALDTDEIAVKAAKANIKANGVKTIVVVKMGTLGSHKDIPERFDLILANITAKVISELAQPLVRALAPSGVLIAGGIIAERLEGVVQTLNESGAAVMEVLQDGDWRTLLAMRK